MCYWMLLFSVLKRYYWLLILQETVTIIVNLKFQSNLHIYIYIYIYKLLSKHFCLQPFFPKDWVFSLFAKSVNLDLQIAWKCISNTLFDFKAMFSINDKHHFPHESYGLVIKYIKFHHPNWCIKVGNTPYGCLVGGSY